MNTETRRLGEPGVQEFINGKVAEAIKADPSIRDLPTNEQINAIAGSEIFELVEMLPLTVRKAIANTLNEEFNTDVERASDDVLKYGDYSEVTSA